MGNAGKVFGALGQGLLGLSNTIVNAEEMKQRSAESAARLEELKARQDEMKFTKATNRFEMGMKLPTPALRKSYLEGPGKEYVNTLFGGNLSGEVINYLSSNQGSEKAKALYEMRTQGMDMNQAREFVKKLNTSGAITDPAVLNNILEEQIDWSKKQAEVAKINAEAQTPLGDPKFAFKTYADEASFRIKDANEKLGSYRANLAKLRDANPNENIESLKRQAMEDSGISSLDHFNQLNQISSMTPTQYAASAVKGRGIGFSGSNVAPISTESNNVTDAVDSTSSKRFATTPAKQMSESEITKLADAQALPEMFKSISTGIEKNADLFGPIEGKARKTNPYDTKTQVFNAEIETSSQMFGKFMEGGVLRKEDEAKYRRMFPQLDDTPEVAKGKIENVKRLFKLKNELNERLLKQGGFNVPQNSQNVEQAPSNEVIRLDKNSGRKAVFDAQTKQFIRWED